METQTMKHFDVKIIAWCCQRALGGKCTEILDKHLPCVRSYQVPRLSSWIFLGNDYPWRPRRNWEIAFLVWSPDKKIIDFRQNPAPHIGVSARGGVFLWKLFEILKQSSAFFRGCGPGNNWRVTQWERWGNWATFSCESWNKSELSWGQVNRFEFSGPRAQDFVPHLCYSHFFCVIYS